MKLLLAWVIAVLPFGATATSLARGSVPTVAPAADTCKSVQLTVVKSWSGGLPVYTPTLSCGGACDNDPTGLECQRRVKTVDGITYEVCSCDPVVMPVCCSLVVVKDADNVPPQVYGDCPGCGTTGDCEWYLHSNWETGGEFPTFTRTYKARCVVTPP